jgi:ParB family transcriptional regulator, chromosome partitioning protein
MTATQPRLAYLNPNDVVRNPENPRRHFPEPKLADLAESIDEVGVLVPISVYPDSAGDQPPYVLLDGERRWICCIRLGLAELPAIIIRKPDSIANIVQMFNIHMVREQWDDMPTAWALQKLVQRTGDTDVKAVAEKTGLHPDRVKRLLFALRLPEEYQVAIDSGFPLNYFFELDRNVVTPLRQLRPAVFNQFGEEGILRSFFQKKEADITPDTVELRRMRPIIDIAAKEAGGPTGESDLDDAIVSLIEHREQTIQDTYEQTVEMVIEADRFSRQCEQLVAKYDRLIIKAESEEEQRLISEAVVTLIEAFRSRLASN